MLRPERLALLLIAAAGVWLRAWPALRDHLTYTLDYDDGLYFAASALLWKGLVPYRDFALTHPPGFSLLLLPFGALTGPVGVAAAFLATRVAIAAASGVTIWLIGTLTSSIAGPVAAVFAAAFYAVFPATVRVEQTTFIEPLLNLGCVLFLHAAARHVERPKERAGPLAALAAALPFLKLWGFYWIASLGWAWHRERPGEEDRRRLLRWACLTAACTAALFGLTALWAGPEFPRQVLWFHLVRPPDGALSLFARMLELFPLGHAPGVLAALSLLAAARPGPRRLVLLCVLSAFAILFAAFLLQPMFYSHYNAHLALPWSILAGVGAAEAHRLLKGRAVLAAAAAALLFLPPVLPLWLYPPRPRPEFPLLADRMRREAMPDGCLFSFEPGWAFAADRLPAVEPPVIVDTYTVMLLASQREGKRFKDAMEALRSPSAQAAIRARIESCPYTALGWRREWRLSDDTRRWLSANRDCRELGKFELCSPKRRPPAAASPKRR